LMDKNVFQMKDGLFRIVNRKEYDRVINNTKEGIQSIYDLKYTIKEIDNIYRYIDISNFSTEIVNDITKNKVHDLRNGPRPFSNNNNNMIVINKSKNTNTIPNRNSNTTPNTNNTNNIKRRGIMRMVHM